MYVCMYIYIYIYVLPYFHANTLILCHCTYTHTHTYIHTRNAHTQKTAEEKFSDRLHTDGGGGDEVSSQSIALSKEAEAVRVVIKDKLRDLQEAVSEYMYICIYVYVCVCVCVGERETHTYVQRQ